MVKKVIKNTNKHEIKDHAKIKSMKQPIKKQNKNKQINEKIKRRFKNEKDNLVTIHVEKGCDPVNAIKSSIKKKTTGKIKKDALDFFTVFILEFIRNLRGSVNKRGKLLRPKDINDVILRQLPPRLSIPLINQSSYIVNKYDEDVKRSKHKKPQK